MEKVHRFLDRMLGKVFDILLTHDDILCSSRFPYVGVAIGIGTSRDGQTVNTRSEAVVKQVATWYLQGRIDKILLVGTTDVKPNGLSEARAMYDWIRSRSEYDSIPDWRIYVIDEDCGTTLKNVEKVRDQMKKYSWLHAMVSAERDHAGRVRATFAKQFPSSGLDFKLCKAPKVQYTWDSGGKFIRRWNFVPYNLLAFLYYKLMGYA